MADMTKSGLAIALSRLRAFSGPDDRLEQYLSDPEIAAEVLWYAFMRGNIRDRTVADLGAGTGMLGIGALMLGAKRLIFVEKDQEAIRILEENLKGYRSYKIIHDDISRFEGRADTVLQNPPFGTRENHADREFLKKAFTVADAVYSFHKTSTKRYILSLAEKSGFAGLVVDDFSFPLKKTRPYHKRRLHRIEVTCFLFLKKTITI
jgi:putative methylase